MRPVNAMRRLLPLIACCSRHRSPRRRAATRHRRAPRSSQRFEAALHADVAALDRLLADDLEYCNFRGDCQTKSEYIGEVKSGAPQVSSRSSPAVDRVKLFADTAVVPGRVVGHRGARRRRAQHRTLLYAGVLAWRDGRWQLTTWSSTLLEPQQAK